MAFRSAAAVPRQQSACATTGKQQPAEVEKPFVQATMRHTNQSNFIVDEFVALGTQRNSFCVPDAEIKPAPQQ